MSQDLEKNKAKGLLSFRTEQKQFEIGGIKIGGQPGLRPTVLIGSAFYHGHKITTDENRGEFDPVEAEKRIHLQDEFSEKTGNPCMLDVVGATPEAIRRHLEFAARVTKSPLLIDGTTVEVRLAGLEYAAQAGLIDRVVYNSIQPEIPDEELTAIQKAGVTSAILLTYYLKDFTSTGRVTAVRELLPRALPGRGEQAPGRYLRHGPGDPRTSIQRYSAGQGRNGPARGGRRPQCGGHVARAEKENGDASDLAVHGGRGRGRRGPGCGFPPVWTGRRRALDLPGRGHDRYGSESALHGTRHPARAEPSTFSHRLSVDLSDANHQVSLAKGRMDLLHYLW